jgi:hypothetical protein
VSRSFDGASTHHVTTGLTAHSATRSYAIWMWITGAGGANLGRLFDKGVEILYHDANTSNIRWSRTHSGGSAEWNVPVPSSSAWHHVALTYDSSSTSNDPVVYIDGASVTVTENAAPSGTASTNADPYVFGGRTAGARTFNGRLAEFAAWDVILTAGEIASIAHGSSPSMVRRSSLVAHVPTWGVDSPEPDMVRGNAAATVTGSTGLVPHPPVQPFLLPPPVWNPLTIPPPAVTTTLRVNATPLRW